VKVVFRALRRAAFAGLLICSVVPARAADACAAPDDITADISPFPRVAAVLKPDSTLSVLTVGSATVFSPTESLQPGTVTGLSLGLGNGPRNGDLMSSDAAFPMQMAKDLEQAVPGLKVNVTVKGGRGMLASEMLDILRSELAAHHYQMVIWQTGTVEAVRNIPVGTFYQTLSDGSALIADAGADLVIVDPQFSRFLRANADLDPYAQTMQQISAQPGVVLFHRFDLMRYWSGEGQIDLERTPKSARLKTVELLHSCLGAILARMVLASAHLPP
jgi:acyl-CoA thioesterase-1